MLTKYGTSNIIVMFSVAAVFLILGIKFLNLNGRISENIPAIVFFLLTATLSFFTFWFFRDPDRTLPAEAQTDTSIIVSPADGVITEIVAEYEKKYLHSESTRISIFLSPLDVHVNRIPVSGNVEFLQYIPGKYIIANHPKASELNEQSQIGVKTAFGKVFFKQIVGMVARRLAYDIKVGDNVIVGSRFGMMKFGSRMDVALPKDAEIKIRIGDRVIAGETIIAKFAATN